MRIFIVLFSLLLCSNLIAQNSRLVTLKKINWTLDLPNDFIIADSNASEAVLKEGVDLVEEKGNIKLDASTTIVLIVASKNKNLFSAIITPFDTKKDNWQEQQKTLKTDCYQLMKTAVPNATLDTASSTIKIDGLLFEKFQMMIKINGKVVSTTVSLSRLYSGYDLGVTYSFTDDATRKQVEGMLSTSKFTK